MKVVYIASPYTLGDTGENVKKQLEAADILIDMGFCPVAPLLMHFMHIFRPRPYGDWMELDCEMVLRSDVLLRLPGESPGADKEVTLAKRRKIPVVYGYKELLKYVPNKITKTE